MLTTDQLARTTCESLGFRLTCENPRYTGAVSESECPLNSPPPVRPLAPQDSISEIDLTMVKRKLMDAEEGPGWSEQAANQVEVRYRRFLTLCLRYPERSIVPTQDIDAMWHAHILDTRAYATDCDRAFGYFMHHYPYFGMNGEADYRCLLSSYEQTAELYSETFGEQYHVVLEAAAGPTRCGSAKCVKCGSGPVKCHHQPARCR